MHLQRAIYMFKGQMKLFDVDGNSLVRSSRKTCVYCKVEKSIAEFPKHIGHKDNLDTRCRQCIKEHSKLRRDLKKTCKVPEPEFCECCGSSPKKTKKLHFDHDHQDKTFRGWLCNDCNVGIGLLGDNIEGVIKAVEFLKMAKERNDDAV